MKFVIVIIIVVGLCGGLVIHTVKKEQQCKDRAIITGQYTIFASGVCYIKTNNGKWWTQ
jgi:hypothetical protein